MEPEIEEGNIEYKLKLLGKDEKRINNLTSQMRWRCDEGNGECIYLLGVADDGNLIGMTEKEYLETINTLNLVANKNHYIISIISKTLVEDDKYIYEILIRENNVQKYIDIKVSIAGSVDSGKCLKFGTKIRLYSGKVKEVQNITTEDVLMGDDSTPRRVLETTTGKNQMYEIIPMKGESFTINKNHILCMKASNYNYIYWDVSRKRWVVKNLVRDGKTIKFSTKNFNIDHPERKVRSKKFTYYETVEEGKVAADLYFKESLEKSEVIKYGEVVEITLEDYVNLNKNKQGALKLYKVGIDYQKQSVDLDPYLLGYWLGDGTSSKSEITTADQEIVDKFSEIVPKYDCYLKKLKSKYKYSINGNLRVKGGNNFLNYLRNYDLLNNKHIPDCYKFNDRQTRLSLIAGLIDSDGYKKGNWQSCNFTMSKNYERLCDDMIEVIRSLGFACYKKDKIKICTNGPNGPTPCECVSFNIDGFGMEEIPCILPRKKFSDRESKRNSLYSAIKDIKIVEEQEYFGFELDGNQRFLLEDFTVSHNSSIIGVLTNGKLDDGRGLARISVFNHPHELKTGRTTSIGHHILGYDYNGSVINYNDIGCKMSWPEIVNKSAKIINILDLCGHEKYLKTTIRGLTSSNPELCMIIVGANKGIKNDKVKNIRGNKGKYENMTREHIFLCVALNIPFAIIVTKIDMIIEQNIKNIYDETMKDIHKVIKSPNVRRQPLKIETNEDVVIAAKQIHSESIVPIFPVSNVTGDGLSNIKSFLNLIPQREQKKITNDVLLYIDGIWNVTGVGTVIGGQLISGEVKINDKLYTGPNGNSYDQLVIKSIQIKRVQVQKAIQGSYVCFGLKKGYDKKNIKRGNVLISNKEQQLSVKIFTANVKILRTHSTTIRVGYQPIVHCSTLRQSAILRKIENKVNSRNPEDTKDDDILRTGDTALVTFEFAFYPVFLTVGTKIVFAENRTKVVGVVTSIN